MSNKTFKIQSNSRITFYGFIAAFCIYFCTYAFRKPFAVGTYTDYVFYQFDYKIVLVIAQLVGYTLSKFIGIQVVSSITRYQRPFMIAACIIFAELALLGFALVKPPFQILFIFLNGLPLGMIWGLVFGYLEGRRVTEMLAIGQSLSFIVSSGTVKAVGKYLIDEYQVSDYWMPFFTGLIFLLPLFFFLWVLNQITEPDELDKAQRVERIPMQRKDRLAYLKFIGPGLILLVAVAILLTIYRDIRDNFAIEILKEIGDYDKPANLVKSELYITIIVFLSMGSIMFIKDNQKAVRIILIMMAIGISSIGISTYAFVHYDLPPYLWFTLIGLGLYLTYVPYHSILYDRIIAAMRRKSNAGYLIYITDAFGYLGAASVMFYKNFSAYQTGSWLDFFIQLSYWITGVGTLLLIGALFYFRRKRAEG